MGRASSPVLRAVASWRGHLSVPFSRRPAGPASMVQRLGPLRSYARDQMMAVRPWEQTCPCTAPHCSLPDCPARTGESLCRRTAVGRRRSARTRNVLHRAAPFGTAPRRRWCGPGLTSSGLPRPASPHITRLWVSFIRLAFTPLLGCPLPISRRIWLWPLCGSAWPLAPPPHGWGGWRTNTGICATLWPTPQLARVASSAAASRSITTGRTTPR